LEEIELLEVEDVGFCTVSPKIVISHIVDEEEENKRNRNKLCFVACCDHEHERQAKDNGDHVLAVPVEFNQCHEHQDHQKSPRKLNILLWLGIFSERWNTSKQRLLFRQAFRVQQQNSSDKGKIPGQELWIPKNRVTNCLHKYDEEKSVASFFDSESRHDAE